MANVAQLQDVQQNIASMAGSAWPRIAMAGALVGLPQAEQGNVPAEVQASATTALRRLQRAQWAAPRGSPGTPSSGGA